MPRRSAERLVLQGFRGAFYFLFLRLGGLPGTPVRMNSLAGTRWCQANACSYSSQGTTGTRTFLPPMVAHAVIVAHNHPSGDPTPSREDIVVTKRLLEASLVVGIPLIDHIVIGNPGFASLRDLGLVAF